MSEPFPGNVCFRTENLVMFECPGCQCLHGIDPTKWTWNGSLEKPTFVPSVLVRGTVPITDEEHAKIMAGEAIEPKPMVCHSYVTDGKIQFLGDCTHELAGKTVALEAFE